MPSMPVPPEVIETQRLVLRRPRAADAEHVYAYGRDPEVTRFMDWETHRSVRDAAEFIALAATRWDSGEEYSWLVTVKPDDVPVGGVGCRVRGHAVDFGYALARGHWGRGYATEAARAVVEWAFAIDGVHRVWATCDTANAASARVLEKAGLTREGVLRKSAVKPNLPERTPRDAFLYSKVREG